MFVFAYSKVGDGSDVVADFPLATSTNYKNAVGTNGVTKGDLVHLASGLVTRAKNVTTPPAALGVLEGTEFLGIADAGGTYAATNASYNASAINTTLFPNGVGKVRRDLNAVYKVAATGGTAAIASVGISCGIAQDAAGDQTIDTSQTTNNLVKIEGVSTDLKSYYVSLL